MMKMSDVRFATELRDLVRRIVQSEIARMYPPDRFAVVSSVDATNRLVTVVVSGETASHVYPYVGALPAALDTVRITGRSDGRYVAV